MLKLKRKTSNVWFESAIFLKFWKLYKNIDCLQNEKMTFTEIRWLKLVLKLFLKELLNL